MGKPKFMSSEECFAAIRQALKLAEVPCNAYPTPEGWERERAENTRIVQRAYRALDQQCRIDDGYRPCLCTKFDDNSAFFLASFAGGAAPDGLFSTVSCVHRKPDGTEEIIRYVRERQP